MKKIITAILVCMVFTLQAQQNFDKIYTGGKVIECTVKEVTPDAVKYSYPNEDLINTIYKNTISRIEFKSGRVETFSETATLQIVRSCLDWEKVNVTQLEYEVKGLFKLGDVSAKAKGATALSNMNKIKERSIKKLKIQAAMMGGNTLYMTQLDTKGNVWGNEYTASQSTETNTSGIAYSNVLPNVQDFEKIVSKNDRFTFLTKYYLGNSNADLKNASPGARQIQITRVYKNQGFIMVNAKIPGEKTTEFRVIYFDEEDIVLMYQDKRKIYNLILKSI